MMILMERRQWWTRIFTVVIVFLATLYVKQTNGLGYLHIKKLAAMAILAKALKPDLIPLPIPVHMGRMPPMKAPEPMIKPIFIPVPIHHYHTSHKIVKSAPSPTKHVILTAPSFGGFGSNIYGGIGSPSLYTGTSLSGGHGTGITYAGNNNYIESESAMRPLHASKQIPSTRNHFYQSESGAMGSSFLPMASAASLRRPQVYLQNMASYMPKMAGMAPMMSMPSMASMVAMPPMPPMPSMPDFSKAFMNLPTGKGTSITVTNKKGTGKATAGGYLSNVNGPSVQSMAVSKATGSQSASAQSSSSAQMSSDGTVSSNRNSKATYTD